MQLTIPDDIQSQLQRQAAQLGSTPEAVALAALREKLAESGGNGNMRRERAAGQDAAQADEPEPKNLAEFLGDFVGSSPARSGSPKDRHWLGTPAAVSWKFSWRISEGAMR